MSLKYIKSPFAVTDAYKLSHWEQYPEGTTAIYSNLTPRKSRRQGVDKFVWFGLQYFLDELTDLFNFKFFSYAENDAVKQFNTFYSIYFGVANESSNEKVRALHKLGYLPIKIKSLPEGSAVNHNVPVMTIESTHDDFFWFAQWVETFLSDSVWKMSTAATTAFYYRRLFDKYNKLTSDIDWIVDFQAHGFEMRGMSNPDDAAACAAGHCLSFKGEDTCPVLNWVDYYYYGKDNGLIATSVPATEHSVQCAFKTDLLSPAESDLLYTLNTLKLYPTGIVSQVSDGYDFWGFLCNTLPLLKDQIMARDGKFVIRPDSSKKTPVEVLIGDPEAEKGSAEYYGVVETLYQIFGGTKNSKGYIDVDSHIGVIYGDSITLEYAEAILKGLEAKGFSSNNVVLGVGSYTYQYVTRDTHGIAVKATCVANGTGKDKIWNPIFKDPKTDNSGKKSAKGFLSVKWEKEEYVLHSNVTREEEEKSDMELIYLNGKMIKTVTYADVRNTLARFR